MVEKARRIEGQILTHRLWGGLIALFLAVSMLEGSVQRCRGSIPQAVGPSTSSVYALAGEFRTVFANLLWIKTDKYLHEYTAHGGDPFQNKEAMPMFRLITELDPHFVEAYRAGAMMLYMGLNKDAEAEKFLHEGISHNPTSWEMYEETGMYYARHKRDLRRGLPYFEKALKYCDDDFYQKRLARLVGSIHRDMKESQAKRS